MEINQVVDTLICTQRIAGLEHCSLRILKDRKGKLLVATDPVGTRPGNWVFTVSGSAGRYAMGDPKILTDLTIGGIIDDWAPETLAESAPKTGSDRGQADAAGPNEARAA
ncbi:MAG: carboxysome peptide B [Thiohalocapsa sp.]|jgi:carboxysome peptide B